jgi:TonB family protein
MIDWVPAHQTELSKYLEELAMVSHSSSATPKQNITKTRRYVWTVVILSVICIVGYTANKKAVQYHKEMSKVMGWQDVNRKDDIKIVRDGTLPNDDSKTLGDVLEKSVNLVNPKWRAFEGSTGAYVVEFRGEIQNPDKLWNEFTQELQQKTTKEPLSLFMPDENGKPAIFQTIGIEMLVHLPVKLESLSFKVQYFLSKADREKFRLGNQQFTVRAKNTSTGQTIEETFDDKEKEILKAFYADEVSSISAIAMSRLVASELSKGALFTTDNSAPAPAQKIEPTTIVVANSEFRSNAPHPVPNHGYKPPAGSNAANATDLQKGGNNSDDTTTPTPPLKVATKPMASPESLSPHDEELLKELFAKLPAERQREYVDVEGLARKQNTSAKALLERWRDSVASRRKRGADADPLPTLDGVETMAFTKGTKLDSSPSEFAQGETSTPLGRYKKSVSSAVGKRWNYWIQKRMSLLQVGKVTVVLTLDSRGKVRSFRVAENTSNAAHVALIEQCVREADFAPPPPGALQNGSFEYPMSFHLK